MLVKYLNEFFYFKKLPSVRAKGTQYIWHGCFPTQRGKSRIWPLQNVQTRRPIHLIVSQSCLKTKSSTPWGSSCYNCIFAELCMQRESFPKTIVLRNAPFLWVAIRKFENLPPYFLTDHGMSSTLQLLLWKG